MGDNATTDNVPCDILVDFDDFQVPAIPKLTVTRNIYKDFDFGYERESLGILPQFKLPLGSRVLHHFELENPESFLTGRPSLLFDSRESLGILPHSHFSQATIDDAPGDREFWLMSPGSNCTIITGDGKHVNSIIEQFKQDCEAIENDEFHPNMNDSNDENYSVYVEANFLASKIADNSILDISQEGGGFLDRTPQPEFVDECESINQSDKKVEIESVFKQLDLLLPPSTLNANSAIQKHILLKQLVDMAIQLQDNDILCDILTQTIGKMSSLKDSADEEQQSDGQAVNAGPIEEDSGHSSTENEKMEHPVLDLSLKAHSSDNQQALDLSFCKNNDVPRRLSITFSHKNDATLPDRQASNKLKQQTLQMRQMLPHVTATSDGSIASTDSNGMRAGSSSNSIVPGSSVRVKLKTKKSENARMGPLKAVVPLASLNTSIVVEHVLPNPAYAKARTPNAKFAPMARSTPEDSLRAERAKNSKPQFPESPIARPDKTSRTSQSRRLNKSTSLGAPKINETTQKSLSRGRSSADLKQSAAVSSRKPSLRRCFSVGGKENQTLQMGSIGPKPSGSTLSKLPKLPLKVLSTTINK